MNYEQLTVFPLIITLLQDGRSLRSKFFLIISVHESFSNTIFGGYNIISGVVKSSFWG